MQTKGFASLEHPAKSARSSCAASIWDLEEVKILLSVPGAEQVDFCQDIHGASSRKPTTLLVLRMPALKGFVQSAQLPLARQQQEVLVGLDDAGRFKTAKAKEYPASMCKALAQGMITAISKHAADRGHEAVEEELQDDVQRATFLAWLQQFDPYSEETHMQADYAGKSARTTKPRFASQRGVAETMAQRMGQHSSEEGRACITDEEALLLLRT